jgi:metal-responsive CopG/Arc/MetJ family transcriptional regulator
MPRRSLDGSYYGESQRLTVRLTLRDLRLLDDLATIWRADRSEVIRRALRGAADGARRQLRQERLDALPTMPVAELRRLATKLRITGRSRMTSTALRAELRRTLTRCQTQP